jgi:hypothetical protein
VNNGVMTIFWNSRVVVQECTFTGNRNGVDDMGGESTYLRSIFCDNQEDLGLKGFPRYELAVNAGATVTGCLFRGRVFDVRHDIGTNQNQLAAPLPLFDSEYVPKAPEYQSAGYRPNAIQRR